MAEGLDLGQLAEIIPANLILTDSGSLAHYGKDWLKDFKPAPCAIVLPESAEQVVALVRWCNDRKVGLVPSGGRTGLSGGATALNGEIVVALDRMRTVHEVNSADRTLRCDAGAITQQVIDAAAAAGLYFPIEFTAIGSSQIGGNIATNAGGIRVIKYGSMREWVLGLDFVTGAGERIQLNGLLEKNNTGYDLRSLVVGSEGTLGIVVGATLKLTTPPHDVVRLLLGLSHTDAALDLLDRCRKHFPQLSAFEVMDRFSVSEVVTLKKVRDPFSTAYECYVLIEIEQDGPETRDRILEAMAGYMEEGLVQDAVVSENMTQAAELMNIRESIGEVLSTHYTVHKNDISVPVRSVPSFIGKLRARLAEAYPELRAAIFGHLGDGNLHVNVVKPSGMADAEFFAECKKADHAIFALVQQFDGSISAEHGVGILKKEFLRYSRTPAEIQLMRGIKAAFDPRGVMNPGKIFD